MELIYVVCAAKKDRKKERNGERGAVEVPNTSGVQGNYDPSYPHHTLKQCNVRQHILYPSTSYLCLSIMPARQPRVRMYASTYDLRIYTYILYKHVVYVRVVRLSHPFIHILHNTYIKNRITEVEEAQHDHGMRVTNSTLA